jgi:hypothetical protein
MGFKVDYGGYATLRDDYDYDSRPELTIEHVRRAMVAINKYTRETEERVFALPAVPQDVRRAIDFDR